MPRYDQYGDRRSKSEQLEAIFRKMDDNVLCVGFAAYRHAKEARKNRARELTRQSGARIFMEKKIALLREIKFHANEIRLNRGKKRK